MSADPPLGLTKAPPGLKARLRANVAPLVVVLVLRWIRNLLDLSGPVSVEAMYAEPVAALEAAAAAVGKAREATSILSRRRPYPRVFLRAVIGVAGLDQVAGVVSAVAPHAGVGLASDAATSHLTVKHLIAVG